MLIEREQVPHRRNHIICRSGHWASWVPFHRPVSICCFVEVEVELMGTCLITTYRVVESTLRTANNLLERLHASFFFYIMTGPTTFLKIGSFLPGAVLVSIAMMFAGLYEWVNAGWMPDDAPAVITKEKPESVNVQDTPKSIKRRRPVVKPLGILIATHVLGLVLFYIITTSFFVDHQMVCRVFNAMKEPRKISCIMQQVLSPFVLFIASALPLVGVLATPLHCSTVTPLSSLVKSFNLCLASTVISITSVLNFSLAATLAVLLGLPLTFASPSPSSQVAIRFIKYLAYIALGLGWIVWAPGETTRAIWNWEILGVWFAPFICIVYTPLVLQAGIVCLLP